MNLASWVSILFSKNMLSIFRSLYMSCHKSRHSKELLTELCVQVVNYTASLRADLEALLWLSIAFLWNTIP